MSWVRSADLGSVMVRLAGNRNKNSSCSRCACINRTCEVLFFLREKYINLYKISIIFYFIKDSIERKVKLIGNF